MGMELRRNSEAVPRILLTTCHPKQSNNEIYENYFQFRISHVCDRGLPSDAVICQRDAVYRHASVSADDNRMEGRPRGFAPWRKDGRARRRSDEGRPLRGTLSVP